MAHMHMMLLVLVCLEDTFKCMTIWAPSYTIFMCDSSLVSAG